MIKHNAKNISNVLKIIIVAFIFFNYMFQSKVAGHPLTSDEGKCLLYIAICGFLILCPIDASIFIKNLKSLQGIDRQDKRDGRCSQFPNNSNRPPASEDDIC